MTDEFRTITMLNHILVRPEMYTESSSLVEILGRLSLFRGTLNDDGSIAKFFDWIQDEIPDLPEATSPPIMSELLTSRFGGEQPALDYIRRTFLDSEDLRYLVRKAR